MKSSTSFRFSSLLFFFFIVASMAVSVYSEECTYFLTVQTGTVAEAGTDSLISVTLGNSAGERFKILNLKKWGIMSPPHDYFKNGNHDVFSVTTYCFPTPVPVCEITVTSDGSGQNPGWFLENVEVVTFSPQYSPHTKIFEFSQWLANELPYELTASRNECESSTSF